jgi:hypothetical protein
VATTQELAEAICTVVETSLAPIPITLMNHDVDGAAEIISAVVQRCGLNGIDLKRVWMDPGLATELGLADGSALPHGTRPLVCFEEGLGRQVRFEKAD